MIIELPECLDLLWVSECHAAIKARTPQPEEIQIIAENCRFIGLAGLQFLLALANTYGEKLQILHPSDAFVSCLDDYGQFGLFSRVTVKMEA